MLSGINSWPTVLKLKDTAEKTQLTCEAPLRILPGKRVVCRGSWQNRSVVAKLFLDPAHAKRHWKREKTGVEALQQAGLDTPELLFAGYLEDRTPVLIFAELPDPQTALEAWQGHNDDQDRLKLLQQLLKVLARHHSAGIRQKDLHLGNFLLSREAWHTIDGDAVDATQLGRPLDLQASLNNLALFFAQLEPGFDYLIEPSLAQYAKFRNLERKRILPLLNSKLSSVRTRRRLTYVKKSYRSCSEFVRRKIAGQVVIYRRDSDPERIYELLDNPDALISSGVTLKNGNSSTVARVPHPEGDWVIKRYNIKNFWHGLKRCLRPSRAWVSWGNAQRLSISGIATPKAIAVIEKRLGPLRLGAYFICENISAPDAQSYFSNKSADQQLHKTTAQNIIFLFEQFHKLGIHHGDCKATNLLIHEQLPWVIDLDAMREFTSRQAFLDRYKTDRQRFLLNWQDQPHLQNWFDQHLPK